FFAFLAHCNSNYPKCLYGVDSKRKNFSWIQTLLVDQQLYGRFPTTSLIFSCSKTATIRFYLAPTVQRVSFVL
ncbi:hypothetical protein, partial [Mesotoga sp. HF07.pep.5.2.highcov]|uniref:hypothetical protein n=1 Tax=Mesotoga sp. HF07.pep.5.2.highcov TaxID=1462923 RepID=UPI001C7D9C57